MSIQKYTDGTIAFDFATDSEVALPIICSMGGAGYDEKGIKVLMCGARGNVRFVKEVQEHVQEGYCTDDTWTEITIEEAFA